MRTLFLALVALAAGCIDEFQGSELQIDFSSEVPVQASPFGAQASTQLPSNIHFTLYAYDESMEPDGTSLGHIFDIQQFEIHRVVDVNSPCFIDVGAHVPIEGLHVSQYADEIKKLTGIDDPTNPPANATEEQKIDVATAIRRQMVVEAMAGNDSTTGPGGPKAITSASVGKYPPIGTSCDDTNGIPPPMCVDDASNKRRLQMCQAAWGKDPALYEGTDRVLTLPLNGTTNGYALGTNPANNAPIGGAAFFVDENLLDIKTYAIFWQYDDADNDGQPDYPASVPMADRHELGTLFMYGSPHSPTRGVIRAHMISLVNPLFTAELAIFADIGNDDVHF